MALLNRFLNAFSSKNDPRNAVRPLYLAIIERGRDPRFFRDGAVPDTIQGRFEMICAILCLVLLRLENTEDRNGTDVLLAELFVEDMDGQLRESGVGDVVVGKKIGNMMGALGGRLGSLREAFLAIKNGSDRHATLSPIILRNVYDGATPSPAALEFTTATLYAIRRDLHEQSFEALMAGHFSKGDAVTSPDAANG